MCPKEVKRDSKVNVVQHASNSDQDTQSLTEEVHTYFGSVELGSVGATKKSKRIFVTLKIARQDVEIKANTGAEATVIPYHLYQHITKKPLQQPLKGWLATKPIHPRGCVRLQTQYKNRQMNLLYLVVDGDFTRSTAVYESSVDWYSRAESSHSRGRASRWRPDHLSHRPNPTGVSRLFQ